MPVDTPPTRSDEDVTITPGDIIDVRDEQWIVRKVAESADGHALTVTGVSDLVRGTEAVFYTALETDTLRLHDALDVTPLPDTSPKMRTSRVALESALRSTPVAMYSPDIAVASRALADPLDYQISAVRRALSSGVSPRILLADAVGLGKTLEIGMIVSELIARGRGERILVVTPRHVLEQFQQELWNRFALPLVRLDSAGVAKVRQKLPASRNPFTYFPRIIASIDTLKSPRYAAQLQEMSWDIVVIDEIHNAVNSATLNNELARILAPRAESVIFASATPHNGNEDSFRELLTLLDPLAVRPDGTIDTDIADSLVIRRHRGSEEVAQVVGEKWATRAAPRIELVDASPAEDAVAGELQRRWIEGRVAENQLFAWTLVKAFLSSPAALAQTIEERQRRSSNAAEIQALDDLATLNEAVTSSTSAKLDRLLAYLREIGVGHAKPERVVIFSERVATLNWLASALTEALGLGRDEIAVMHGALSDEEQMDLIARFKQKHSRLRILVTGDVASEGVNLHAQCHHLVHFDIPWSLIRLQQRNGRIDRYGQTHSPVITSLILAPTNEALPGEVQVLSRLLEREHEAHEVLGDAAPLMGYYSERREEQAIRDLLRRGGDVDEIVPAATDVAGTIGDDTPSWALFLTAPAPASTSETETLHEAGPDTLYPLGNVDFVEDALTEAFVADPQAAPQAGGCGWRREGNGVAELVPPPDLQRRFEVLPTDYVKERHLADRLVLATTKAKGRASLEEARDGQTAWPAAHFLGPLHPVSSWAAERAQIRHDVTDLPVVAGEVDAPSVLFVATITNRSGQTMSRMFAHVDFTAYGAVPEVVAQASQWLRDVGVPDTNFTPATIDTEAVRRLVREAADILSPTVYATIDVAARASRDRVDEWLDRARAWEDAASRTRSTRGLERRRSLVRSRRDQVEAMATSATSRAYASMIRPLLVLLPHDWEAR